MTALDLGNTYGAVASYTYDEVTQRLTGIAVKREQINGTDLNVAYTYDQAGNLTSATDTPGNLLLAQKPDRQCFTYDGLRRLTAAWTSKASTCGSEPTSTLEVAGAAPYWDTYGYDDLGNRRALTARRAGPWGSWTGATTTASTYSYGQGQAGPHALTGTSTATNGAAPTTAGYEYDAAGRQTARPGSGPLVWDGEGELTAVGTAGSRTSMVYDANGERLTRTDSSGTTVYLPGGQEIRVEDGKVVSAVRYYSFGGQTVAVRTGKGLGAVTSLVADMHGTALIAIANTTWTTTGVVKQYTDPFGAARGAGVDVPGERQFLDKTRDPSTGLTQVGARYYDETTGRFISVDPVLDLTNPQQWNAYVYANNNPTTWSDPTGLFSWGSIGDVLSGFGKGTYNTVTSVTRSLNPVSVVQSITAMPAIAKENGGGAWGWYTSATLTFNPMYGAVANTYATVDAVQAGNVEAAAFHATSAVQTTAITAATLYLPVKGGIGAMTGKGARPTTTVNGGGGPHATVPEATTPELPATAANTAVGFADDAVASAYQGMRSGGGHAIRHLRDEGLIANSGSLSSQVAQFEQLTSPILRAPTRAFDWRVGETMTRAFAGEAGGRQVVVFVAKEGPYQGSVLSAVVPDAAQMAQWGLP